MNDDRIRNEVLDALIEAAEAQLRELRRLRASTSPAQRPKPRRSKLDLVEDVLRAAGSPLHVDDIIRQARSRHGAELDRESIVSALTKQVNRSNRFRRTAPNTFDVLKED